VESAELVWTDGGGRDEVSPFLARLRRNWIAAAATMLLSGVGATVLAFMLPSYWRVEIIVMPVKPSAGLGNLDLGSIGGLLGGSGLAGVGASLLGGRSSGNQDEALAILASRELFDAYATRENLLPKLFDTKWDAENSRWKVGGERVPTLRAGYKLFSRSVRDITQDRRTGIVTMALTWKDREAAVKWARDLIALTNEQMRQHALAEAKDNMAYLQSALAKAQAAGSSNALSSALANAYERALQSYMYASGQPDYAFRIIDPPTLPDARERVFPKRSLFLVLGLIFGALLALPVTWILDRGRAKAPTP
jgi:uncharacterized protein involved in exopolysaccharide biosynthesis